MFHKKINTKEFKSPEQRIVEADDCCNKLLKSIQHMPNSLNALQTHLMFPLEESADIIREDLNTLYQSLIPEKKQEANLGKLAKEFLHHLDHVSYDEKTIDNVINSLEPLCAQVSLFIKEWNSYQKTIHYLFQKKELPTLERQLKTLSVYFIKLHDLIIDTAFPPSTYQPPPIILSKVC